MWWPSKAFAKTMLGSRIADVFIAAFFALFVVSNIKGFEATGDMSYVLVAVNEAVYVLLYLLRQRAVATSASVFDWSIAFAGTFVGTLLRPASPFDASLGSPLIVLGTLINIAAVLSLGRSIAIIAAERTIKADGLYRLVRHPMYGSEILVLIGYLLVNFSLGNALVALSNIGLLLLRAEREELFLSRSEAYRSYLAKVRWKLVPFVY